MGDNHFFVCVCVALVNFHLMITVENMQKSKSLNEMAFPPIRQLFKATPY